MPETSNNARLLEIITGDEFHIFMELFELRENELYQELKSTDNGDTEKRESIYHRLQENEHMKSIILDIPNEV